MSKDSLKFRDLIELIDKSVKSGKIQNDYHYFLKSCRDLGISSYILNSIIIRAKEDCNNDDYNQGREVDYSFFVPFKPKREKKKEDSHKEIQVVTKIQRKNSKIVWLFITLLLCCCVVEAIYMYNITEDKKLYSRRLEEINSENEVLRKKLDVIFNMTSNLSENSSFSNWHSSNHDKSSESHRDYSFTVSKGDKLSFNYYVSSEPNYDYQTITLSGDSISSSELVKTSGDSHNSRVFEFERGGKYNLQVKYSKDSSVDKNNDNAGVSNIFIYRNYKNILEKIHLISDRSNAEGRRINITQLYLN